MTEEKYVQVRNLSGQPVTMIYPDEHIRIPFGPTETKEVAYSDLRKIYAQGGEVLLHDFLAILDKDIAQEFGVSEDLFTHEYSWTKEDVVDLLNAEDKMDELEDALDFAPEGIREMIINTAVELRIPDINKRRVISEATGRDIDAMIRNQEQLEMLVDNDEEKKPKRTERRAAKKTEGTGRRAS